MVVVIPLQVIFRYLLNNALPWPDEAARFLMLWMTGLIAPAAYPTLQGIIRHHLNPQKAYVRWSKQDANLPPALWLGEADFVSFEDKREQARLKARLDIQPVELTDFEIYSLGFFLNSLTGTVSVSGKFGKPDRVPSGLRVD